MQGKLVYWIWLSLLQKTTPREKKMLLEHFIDPEKVWCAGKKEISDLSFMNSRIYAQIMDTSIKGKTELVAREVKDKKIGMVTINDENYPQSLKEIYDPPVVLYTKGELATEELMIAIVGSRKASPYGVEVSETLSYGLAKRGIPIISGMARGIDSYSHCGALEGGGKTIAVLGCGVDVVYPPENRKLMNMIMKNGGVISEYPPGMKPLPLNFIARNRIISGLSAGTVVIEAGNRSGSLITAGYALEQGREVFAVPGNINNPGSKGTNRLIREGAKIVTCIDDILEELRLTSFGDGTENKKNEHSFGVYLDSREKEVISVIERGVSHVDVISRETGIAINELESMLLLLEMKGAVRQSPGRLYRLKRV